MPRKGKKRKAILNFTPEKKNTPKEPKNKKKKLEPEIIVSEYLSRQSKRLPAEKRRLDSLAKLLEGEGICASVCLFDNKILVTSNSISAFHKENFQPRNQHVLYLKKLLTYFMSYQYSDTELALKLLFQICRIKMDSIERGDQELAVDDETLEKIILYLLTIDNTGRDWLDKLDGTFFHQFLQWCEGENTSTGLNRLEKESAIRHNFKYCWEMVTAFQKTQSFFEKNKENIHDCHLLAVGGEKEHAELRLVGYLLENNKSILFHNGEASPIHLGISKLCCAQCALSLDIVNRKLKQTQNFHTIGIHTENDEGEEISIDTSADFEDLVIQQFDKENTEESDSSFDNSQIIQDLNQAISHPYYLEVSGHHGLGKSKATPNYLLGELYLPQPCTENPTWNRYSKLWSVKTNEWTTIDRYNSEATPKLLSFYQELAASHKEASEKLQQVKSCKKTHKKKSYSRMNRSPSTSPISPHQRKRYVPRGKERRLPLLFFDNKQNENTTHLPIPSFQKRPPTFK